MHSSSIPTERWLWVYNGRAASGKQSPGLSPRFGHHYPHLHAGSIVFVIFTLICAHHAFFLFVLLFFYLSFSPFEGVVLRLSLRTPWSGGAGAGRLLGRTAKFNHLRTRSNQASKASGTKTSRRRRRRTRHCTAGGGEKRRGKGRRRTERRRGETVCGRPHVEKEKRAAGRRVVCLWGQNNWAGLGVVSNQRPLGFCAQRGRKEKKKMRGAGLKGFRRLTEWRWAEL